MPAVTVRQHLAQSEIAATVLSTPTDFNPLDDATVRKLATLTRQRLTFRELPHQVKSE